jgi:hypothetical protein
MTDDPSKDCHGAAMRPAIPKGNPMTTITTHFDVYDMTSSSRSYVGERSTFDEAEHLARWHAARRGIRLVVSKVTADKKRRYSDEMASISRDALGRVWTDLTWHGAWLI